MHRGGEGEPLVLIHGLGSTRRIWDQLLDRLEPSLEVFAFSLPGFGDSPWDGRSAGVPYLADTIEAEMDALGFETAHVAGHSMGGWITAELAVRRRARTATLIDPGGLGTDKEKRRIRARYRFNRAAAKRLASVADPVFRLAPVRAALTFGMRARGWKVSGATVAAETRAFAACPAYEASAAWMVSHRAEGLERITCPTLVIWGTWDLLHPYRHSQRWIDAIDGAELLALPRLGHDPISDDPEAVAAAILETTASA
jgi:pimeloyl-ACP methyl ester carboxylesterase